jgi:hypothetical protein
MPRTTRGDGLPRCLCRLGVATSVSGGLRCRTSGLSGGIAVGLRPGACFCRLPPGLCGPPLPEQGAQDPSSSAPREASWACLLARGASVTPPAATSTQHHRQDQHQHAHRQHHPARSARSASGSSRCSSARGGRRRSTVRAYSGRLGAGERRRRRRRRRRGRDLPDLRLRPGRRRFAPERLAGRRAGQPQRAPAGVHQRCGPTSTPGARPATVTGMLEDAGDDC